MAFVFVLIRVFGGDDMLDAGRTTHSVPKQSGEQSKTKNVRTFEI